MFDRCSVRYDTGAGFVITPRVGLAVLRGGTSGWGDCISISEKRKETVSSITLHGPHYELQYNL